MIARVAFRPREVAVLAVRSVSLVKAAIWNHTCAAVPVGGRIIVLAGDAEVFCGSDPSEDGKTTLAGAWRDRVDLTLAEVAPDLGVSTRHLQRLASTGELPGRMEAGRWVVNRDDLVRHLLRLRAPAWWEVRALTPTVKNAPFCHYIMRSDARSRALLPK